MSSHKTDGWMVGGEKERRVTAALTSGLVYSAQMQGLCFVCACLNNRLCLLSLRIPAKKDEEGASRPALLCECLHPEPLPPLNDISPLAVGPIEASHIWPLKPSSGLRSGGIAAVHDFQLLLLCISATARGRRHWGEGVERASHSPSHSFAACIYSVLCLWVLYFMTTFLPRCQVYPSNHWREFIPAFDGSCSTSFFSLPHPSSPLLLSGLPISSSALSPTSQPTPTAPPAYSPLLPATLPPLFLSLTPSPIPLSQLPVELAAVQDSADGSVIRSASLRSLSASPLFFSLFFSPHVIKLQKET